ncbi:hypothetical protein ABIE56_001369 [Luteibacter sp. 621]
MDAIGPGREAPMSAERVVARPHVPALLWYGAGALVFGVLVFAIARTIVWDGTVMVLVPVAFMLAFALPLFLAVRNLTAVAILDGDELELRRFFMSAWRVRREQVVLATPTKGLIEGRLTLFSMDAPNRAIPGFLVRSLRGTWVERLRDQPLTNPFANMSRDEFKAYVKTAHRSTVERDDAFGASPEERWQNWSRWNRQERTLVGISVALCLLSMFMRGQPIVWFLSVLNLVGAITLSVRTRFFGLTGKEAGKGIGFLLVSLLPGVFFFRGMFDWQILDPGLWTMALYVAGIIVLLAGMPPWRGLGWKDRVRFVAFSALVFGLTAFWADRMLAYANMRFDRVRPSVVEAATIIAVTEEAASRSTPASLVIEFGGTSTFTFGLRSRFPLYALPPGRLVVGNQCALVVRPSWLGLRWVDVPACRSR